MINYTYDEHESTLYYSALDNLSTLSDENTNESSSSSVTMSGASNNSTLDDHYYTRLRVDSIESTSNYTSLNFLQHETSIDSTANDSIIAAYTQLDELSKVGGRGRLSDLDPSILESIKCLETVEKNLFKSFEKKIRNRKIKYYNLDQTIEETLDEIDYENILENVIKKIATKAQYVRSNSPPRRRSKRLSEKCKKDPSTDQPNYQNGKHQQASVIIDNESDRFEYESSHQVKEEYDLMCHAFELIKDSNITRSYETCFSRYRCKLVEFVKNSGSSLIKTVAMIFLGFIGLDMERFYENFKRLSPVDKWNVLKNVLYYAVKMSLLAFSGVFLNKSENDESVLDVLNSMFNYVKNFEKITNH